MKTTAVVMTLLLSLPFLLPAAAEDPAPPAAAPALSVEIAAPAHHGARNLDPAGFDVVVANRSAADLGVWREWCSWGWFQLSFEVKDAEGKVHAIAKKDRGWDKNYPDAWTLAPGEPLVLAVHITSDDWTSDLPLASLSGKAVEVRAVFTSDPDEMAKEQGVWTGRVTSPWRAYGIR